MGKIHEYLESKRIQVDWKKCNPVHKGPRWGIFVVDNVAAGYADTSSEPAIEGYFTVYICDLWIIYHACSFEGCFQLYEIQNVVFFRDDTPEGDRNKIEQDWCYGQDTHDPLVLDRDIMRPGSGWVLVEASEDDGECPEDREDNGKYWNYIQERMCAERENPVFC